MMTSALSQLKTNLLNFARMIKISHSVFALPFALSASILAFEVQNSWSNNHLSWIILAMFTARTAAMTFNRFIDAEIDGKNERTRQREIPSGKLKSYIALVITIISSILFVFAAFQLNQMCFYLSPIALLVILGYSYSKRFTYFCHFILGTALALSPLGAWLAISNRFDILPIILALAVLFWVAGFDILYAIQDEEFDKAEKLFSIPAHFGKVKAMIIAQISHLISFLFFLSMLFFYEFHPIIYLGFLLILYFIIYEYRLLKKDYLKNLNLAFFNLNAGISVGFLIIIITHHILTH